MTKRLIPRSVVMVEATKPTIDDAGSLDIPEGQTYQIGGVPHTHDGLSGGGGTAVSIFAGAGLTGGGLLTGSRGLDVGAGTLIGVTADAVNLADGTEQYQVPVTGATPFTPAWTALSAFAGTALNFTSGAFHLDTPGTLSASSTNQAIDAHTHAIDTTLARAAVSIIAGAGLTGGGDLTASRTLDVGAGTLITVAADSVSLASGSAQYQVPVTGATPFAPAYTALSAFAGTALNFTSGAFHLDVPGTLSASSTNQAIDAHTHQIDTTLARAAVSIIAGAGLTGGGDLTASRTLDVGAGTLITVAADSVSLASGSAQYQVPVTGATPFTPAYTLLSTFAGTALNFTSGAFHLDVPGTLSASSTNQAIDAHTHAIDATLARAAVSITAGAGLTGGGDLTASRTLDVGAGTLITVAADSVSLAVGTAQYQVPVTGATPFTPAYTLLSAFAGTALNFTSGAFHLD